MVIPRFEPKLMDNKIDIFLWNNITLVWWNHMYISWKPNALFSKVIHNDPSMVHFECYNMFLYKMLSLAYAHTKVSKFSTNFAIFFWFDHHDMAKRDRTNANVADKTWIFFWMGQRFLIWKIMSDFKRSKNYTTHLSYTECNPIKEI